MNMDPTAMNTGLGIAGAVMALAISAAGSALGTGAAGSAAVGAWKKCYAQGKQAPFLLLSFVGAPLTQTLYGMIVMFAMIARAEAGAPSGALADMDVSAVVADMAELYSPVAEDEDIVVETAIAEGVHLRGNRELIGQAMVNLLENAVKYARPDEDGQGRITVGLREHAGRVLIEVADNGPGIPEADRKRVLERFVRLEKSRSEPGSGLGLSLVGAVARLHGGSFRIEDNAPGVRAVIDLPAA